MIRRPGLELGRQLGPAGRSELVGVEPWLEAQGSGCVEDPAGLLRGEHADFTEDVAEAGPALRGDPRELDVDHVPDVRLRTVRTLAELRRDRVGAEERRHDVDRALDAEAMGDLEQPQLGRQVEPIA